MQDDYKNTNARVDKIEKFETRFNVLDERQNSINIRLDDTNKILEGIINQRVSNNGLPQIETQIQTEKEIQELETV